MNPIDIITLKVDDYDNFIHIIADRRSGEAAVVREYFWRFRTL